MPLSVLVRGLLEFSTVGVGADQIMTNETNLLDPHRPGRHAELLDAGLRRLVIGQDEAINKIVDLYQMYMTGLTSPGRPIGNVLFLGPTGSGKTRLVEATAETLFGSADAVVKINWRSTSTATRSPN